MGNVRSGAIGVNPRMDLQATLSGLADEKSQWIVARRLALRSREETAPRFQRRGVERITFGAHLQQYRVQSSALGGIQQADGLGFLRVHAEALLGWEVDIVHGGNPSALHLGADDRAGEEEKDGECCEQGFHFSK